MFDIVLQSLNLQLSTNLAIAQADDRSQSHPLVGHRFSNHGALIHGAVFSETALDFKRPYPLPRNLDEIAATPWKDK